MERQEMGFSFYKSSLYTLFIALSLCLPATSYALVLHSKTEPNLAQWTDRPDPNVVGKWISDTTSTNGRASCVAVSPKYVVTTRHQGGGTGGKIEIGGVLYSIAAIINCPDNPNPSNPDYKRVDLRLVKLADADLKNYVPLNTSEDIIGANIVLGGFGLGRGADLLTNGIVYGYQWQDRGTYRNNYQRWATNIADRIDHDIYFADASGTVKYNLDLISADFDGTQHPIDDQNVTAYEGTPAEFDSGGGWFVKDGQQWKLAALTRGVEHFPQSWFREIDRPTRADPDGFDAVLISSYADWILENIAVEGDRNGDYHVNFLDFALLAADWQNGQADIEDLAFMAERWLNNE